MIYRDILTFLLKKALPFGKVMEKIIFETSYKIFLIALDI